MVITMRAMGEVQMTVDEIVDMVSVRHGLVATVCAVAMAGLMSVAAMGGRASGRVLRSDTEPMFIDMVAVWMVQMPIMQVVGVTVMGDGRMPAVRSVLMGVMLMDGVVAHRRTPLVTEVGSHSVVEV